MMRDDIVVAVVPAGHGSQDEDRVRHLLGGRRQTLAVFTADRTRGALVTNYSAWRYITTRRPGILWMEGTGVRVGIAVLFYKMFHPKCRLFVSSGDPVSSYVRTRRGVPAAAVMWIYERVLLKSCDVFVGWSPYLTGRAIHFGAKSAFTLEGAVDTSIFVPLPAAERAQVRNRYGIPLASLCIGMIGSLSWNERTKYCYGLELINAAAQVKRLDTCFLIVGGGSGLEKLKNIAADLNLSNIVFTGRVTRRDIPNLVGTMDIGVVTQSLDRLGMQRLSTKLPEYLACGVPVLMSPIAGYFDYVVPAGYDLPTGDPSSDKFASALACKIDTIATVDLARLSGVARLKAVDRFAYVEVRSRLDAVFESFTVLNKR